MTIEEVCALAQQIFLMGQDVKIEISVRSSGGTLDFVFPKRVVVHGGIWSGIRVQGLPSLSVFWKEEWFKELCQSHGITPEVYDTGE